MRAGSHVAASLHIADNHPQTRHLQPVTARVHESSLGQYAFTISARSNAATTILSIYGTLDQLRRVHAQLGAELEHLEAGDGS